MVLADMVGALDYIVAVPSSTVGGALDYTAAVALSGTVEEQAHTEVARDPLAVVVAQPVAVEEDRVAPFSPLNPAGQQ